MLGIIRAERGRASGVKNVGIAGLALVLVLASSAIGLLLHSGCANLTEGRSGELNAAIMRARKVHLKRRRWRLRPSRRRLRVFEK
jgi:hypothetical protein